MQLQEISAELFVECRDCVRRNLFGRQDEVKIEAIHNQARVLLMFLFLLLCFQFYFSSLFSFSSPFLFYFSTCYITVVSMSYLFFPSSLVERMFSIFLLKFL